MPTGGANLTPREIVSELDRYIVGQTAAKRAVAIALRNRWRRQQVTGELKDEITPKNIILIGPTGVGKDGDRPAAGAPGPGALRQGRGEQVHRGGLRGPRRRVDGARPGRGLHRAGPRGGDGEGAGPGPRGRRGPPGRAAAPRRRAPPRQGAWASPPRRRLPAGSRDAEREKLRAQLRAGTLDDRTVELDVAGRRADLPPQLLRPRAGGDGRQPRRTSSSPCPGCNGPGAGASPSPRRSSSSPRRSPTGWWTRTGSTARRCRGPSPAASSSSTRSTRSPAARARHAAAARTSRARACSATSFPSSRGAPSPPSTGR